MNTEERERNCMLSTFLGHSRLILFWFGSFIHGSIYHTNCATITA